MVSDVYGLWSVSVSLCLCVSGARMAPPLFPDPQLLSSGHRKKRPFLKFSCCAVGREQAAAAAVFTLLFFFFFLHQQRPSNQGQEEEEGKEAWPRSES